MPFFLLSTLVSLLCRALTAVELRKKLLSKGFSPNAVEAVINKLQRQYVANFIYRNCWAIVYQ
jgi:SOS response regulatory protein OraA/RecX